MWLEKIDQFIPTVSPYTWFSFISLQEFYNKLSFAKVYSFKVLKYYPVCSTRNSSIFLHSQKQSNNWEEKSNILLIENKLQQFYTIYQSADS